MKKNRLVFSLVHEQSVFMTVVISVLTFLAVLSFGIALSVSTGIIRWNNQWERYATIQVTNQDNIKTIEKIFKTHADKIESMREITKSEMENLMKPWVSSGAKLDTYLPQMYEIKLKKIEDMKFMKNEIISRARFLTHTAALQDTMNTGWKIVGITTFIFMLMLISIGVCVSYISRNIAMLHKHELEILNQVGANDKFIANQMQMIVGKISLIACAVGFIISAPILLIILGVAHSARVGMLATLTLSGSDWFILFLLPIIIVIFSVYITKKTTIKILSNK